jgi:hypothetical protein
MEKRLNDKIMEMRKDIKRMLDRMEARDNKAEQAEATTNAQLQEFHSKQFQPEYQYLPFGMHGYHNYPPHGQSAWDITIRCTRDILQDYLLCCSHSITHHSTGIPCRGDKKQTNRLLVPNTEQTGKQS